MPEATEYQFAHKELATLLVKQQQLHEGIWAVSYKLAFGATNFGANITDVIPTGMVQILSVGLARVDRVNSVSVDAAEVNPAPVR